MNDDVTRTGPLTVRFIQRLKDGGEFVMDLGPTKSEADSDKLERDLRRGAVRFELSVGSRVLAPEPVH